MNATTTTPTAGGCPATMTPLDKERKAAGCCDAAAELARAGDYEAALCGYDFAEFWLWRADRERGIDTGRPVLDARVELERLAAMEAGR